MIESGWIDELSQFTGERGYPPACSGLPAMNGFESFRDAVAARDGVYVIGVAGDSGSGKTSFTESIRHLFGDRLVSTITLDDYHILNRKQRKEKDITPLAPEANDLAGLGEDLVAIRQGKPIEKMVYDHSRGILTGPVRFTPAKIVILEGLHTLFTPQIRESLDFSLYVDPADDVKKEWKLKRDMQKRGYSEREVMEEIRGRQQDYERYIAPQKEYADAVIRIEFSQYGRDLGWLKNIYRTTLSQIPVRKSHPDAGLMLDLVPLLSLEADRFSVSFARETTGGREMAALTFDGEYDCHFISGLMGLFSGDARICLPRQPGSRPLLTPPDIVKVLLAWRIIQDIIAP